MNRATILMAIVMAGLCLPASLCYAWPEPPDVRIYDWVRYVGPDEEFEFYAEDYSGTDIQYWWWDYPSGSDLVYEDDYGGPYGCSWAGFTCDSPGIYYFYATAENDYDLTDDDWAKAVVVQVTIDDCPAAIPYQGSADISFSMAPDCSGYRYYDSLYIKDPNGQTIQTSDCNDDLGSLHYWWNGKKSDGNWAPAGLYTVTVELHVGPNGSVVFSDSCTINIVPHPPTAVMYSAAPTTVATGYPVIFDANSSTDPNGRPITQYLWEVTHPSYTISSTTNRWTSITFNGAGTGEVRLQVKASDGEWSSVVSRAATSVQMSLTGSAWVQVNDDDDNLNGTEDLNEQVPPNYSFPSTGDNDMPPFDVNVTGADPQGHLDMSITTGAAWGWEGLAGRKKLIPRIPGSELLGMFKSLNPPPNGNFSTTIYVEGRQWSPGWYGSDPFFTWRYFNPDGTGLAGWNDYPANSPRSQIWFGVVLIDMQLAGMSGAEETVPGGFIPLNDSKALTTYPPNPWEPEGIYYGDWLPVTLSVEYSGQGRIEVRDPNGLLRTLPYTFLPAQQRTFSVKGIQTSSAAKDITLILTHEYTSFKDKINLTVMKVDLAASDLYGAVPDANDLDPGAFIHFNIDNDDASNNTVESPQHPGADYANDEVPVQWENDLKPITLTVSPLLNVGYVALINTTGGEIWKTQDKGQGNRVVLANDGNSWDLADPNERNAFQQLCANPLYVEGSTSTGGTVSLSYLLSVSGPVVATDEVKYTFIAADCGNQPTTINGQRSKLEAGTGLVRCEWSITGAATWAYNCIAWSVDEPNEWYDPWDIDLYWGDHDGIFEDSDMDAFYATKKGWSLIETGSAEQKANEAEAMYYSYGQPWNYVQYPDNSPSPGYHGARRRTCNCGAGQWIMYESKCGHDEKIEHVWNQLNGSSYGDPDRFYN